ncbi:MAG: MBL fold metallo-hydrolase, partial [Methylophilus sp.]
VPHAIAGTPVTDFESHIAHMIGFHKRYMVSNKACRLWANMIRKLEIKAIVPQHGQPFMGDVMVNKFINWVENLQCGLDLFTQQNYQIPE